MSLVEPSALVFLTHGTARIMHQKQSRRAEVGSALPRRVLDVVLQGNKDLNPSHLRRMSGLGQTSLCPRVLRQGICLAKDDVVRGPRAGSSCWDFCAGDVIKRVRVLVKLERLFFLESTKPLFRVRVGQSCMLMHPRLG